ncbi:MAG: ComF family protein [Paracoccaceae bacterium]
MWAGFQTAVQLIYPARCIGCGDLVESDFGLCGPCWRETGFIGGTVCDACGAPVLGAADGFRLECDDCLTRPRPWDSGRASMVYADLARKLVLALKHGDRTEIARPAGHWLSQAARPLLSQNTIIVPVPLHRRRLMQRKYNQSAILAQSLASIVGHDLCLDALLRYRPTPKLEHVGVDERFTLLTNAIRPHPKRLNKLQGRSVLLVDDVMTSGATLTACTNACLHGGVAKVDILVLARRCRN